MVNVKGRWALITGASRGIGRLTALFMAEQGCNLILHSRKLEHTEKLLDAVVKSALLSHLGNLCFFACFKEPLCFFQTQQVKVLVKSKRGGFFKFP